MKQAILIGGTVAFLSPYSALEAAPVDLELYADLRLTHASGEPSWFNDWLGKGRYGGDRWGNGQTKLRLSEVSAIAKYEINWDFKAFAHVKYDPEQQGVADLVEAYVTYAPAPKSEFSYQLKAGLFFPHISRENVGIAWTTPYSITPSAINSWVGEEIRVLGLEAKGTYKAGNHKVDVTAAAFGFNDPAGSLLAFRGWGLGDHKVGAFSRVPLAPLPNIGPDSSFLKQPLWVEPVHEIDGKVGFYGAFDYSYGRKYKIGAYYYDNRGDPEVIKQQQYAWDTRFWNIYAEADFHSDFKFIAQYMVGETLMGFPYGNSGARIVDVEYDAAFVLLTKKMKTFRATVRYDWFGVDDNSFEYYDNNNEDGEAFTAAFSAQIFKKTTIIAEYLHIDSWRPSRKAIGFDADQKNNILQLSIRQRF
jgi:hypothetical protein